MTERSSEVLYKTACTNPACGSSDAMAVYDDGHTYCFSCNTRTKGDTPTSPPATKRRHTELLSPDTERTKQGLSKRRLSGDTLRRFGYFIAPFKGDLVQVAPFTDPEGAIVRQKLRFADKEFVTLGDGPGLTKCQLFGQSVWGDRYDQRVVVTEGEIDCMSAAQVMHFRVPCVSLNGGAASAVANCKANYLWLDRFKEIILWFDDDGPGQKAAEEVARLFKVGKVKVAKVNGFKDASDVLMADMPGDIEAAIYSAVVWRPRGIINARDSASHVMAPKERVTAWSYPEFMKRLQDMTGGIHRGEVIYHVAGTGVGKSSALREIQYHLLEQGVKIAVLSFEDSVRDAEFGLMSIRANERLQLVPVPDPDDKKAVAAYDKRMAKLHAEVFASGNVELFDPETAEWSMDAILGYVRYCARALDCQVVFIDPLSFVVSGIELSADERRVLDRVAAEFAKMAKELNIALQISHHLKRTSGVPHEEGAPTSLNELRSSGGLANFAMGVIGWERNTQASGDSWRVMQSRVIKALRRTGQSGIADVLYYQENGRMAPSTIPMPEPGKPDTGQSSGQQWGFTPLNQGTDY